MISVGDIVKDFTTNAGGLIEINMALIDDIAAYPLRHGSYLLKGFKMKAGKSFHTCYFTPDSGAFNQSFDKTIHGKESSFIVPFSFPNATEEDIYQMDRMRRMKFVIVPKDNNGYYRVIGTPESPAVFTFSELSNDAFNKGKRCSCAFSAKSNRSAPYYMGEFNRVIYNEGYNFGFLKTI